MDSNTHSTSHPAGTPAGVQALVAELQRLADQDPNGLADGAWAERVGVLGGLADRLDGHWLAELAGLDARGAAGADQGLQAGSTVAWLRHRLRMGAGTDAEPVLLEAARRLDPPRLRRVLGHLRRVADPEGVDAQAERQHQQRGLWLTPTWEGMVAVNGLLEPEAGQTLLAALKPLARPTSAADTRSGGQRRADALAELARRSLEGGRLPQRGGVRPQLLVTVDLDSLLGLDGLGGEVGGAGPLDPETCRRLACDGAVTRVLVTRQPPGHGGHGGGHGPDDATATTTAGAVAMATTTTAGTAAAGAATTTTTGTTTASTVAAAGMGAWRSGCGRRWRCFLQSLVVRPPAAGGRPHQPRRLPRPTQCPGHPRRRLWVPRLRPAPGLVRGPPSAPLAPWRPHRPGESGVVVPGPPPGGP